MGGVIVRMPSWLVPALAFLAWLAMPSLVLADDATTKTASSDLRAVGLGAAAAFAIAMSIGGAAHAVGKIGSAALGAAAEKPELLTRSILFVALAEGLAILGFAIAMVLAQKI